MKPFVDVVKHYSAWKLQEKGSGKLTRKELVNLREMYNSSRKPTNGKAKLKEAYLKYQAWKKTNQGTDKVTKEEFALLKEKVLGQQSGKKLAETKNNWNVYFENYKKFKESKEPGAKISYKELKMLKESFRDASTKGIKLREADMGMDPAAAAPQAGDPNAMAAPADPNAAAGGAQDPMAMQGAIDQAIQALQPFSQTGQNGLAADPNAGIPPVDGTQPADPNAAAAPMMEAIKAYSNWKLKNKGTAKLDEAEINYIKSKFPAQKSKYQQIKERIAARQQKLAALQENGAQDYARKELASVGLGKMESNSSGKGSVETNAEQVTVPAAGTLANGYSSGEASKETKPAKTWPTKAMGKEAGGALQGAGATQTKVKESEECDCGKDDCPKCSKGKKIEESVKTVTDLYVDRLINEPKLNFGSLKEAMSKGLLG